MVRKLEVRCLHFNLRHVARRAILIRHRTTIPVTGFRVLISEGVTLQTTLVVISRFFAQRLVRIVTRGAAYIPIVRITFAAKNTIRLKANVVDPQTLQRRKLFGSAMTRRAKLLRQLVATQEFGIEDRLRRRFTGFDSRDVLSAWTMTRLAAHAVRELFET